MVELPDKVLIGARTIDFIYGNTQQIFEIVAVATRKDIMYSENPLLYIEYPIKFELMYMPEEIDKIPTNMFNVNEELKHKIDNTEIDEIITKRESYKTILSKYVYDNNMYIPKNNFIIQIKTSNKDIIKKHIEYYLEMLKYIEDDDSE